VKIEASAGAEAARRWYGGQATRSVLPILSRHPIAPRLALRLITLVGSADLAATWASSIAGLQIEHVLGQSHGTSFVALYLAATGIAGMASRFIVCVAARRYAFIVALLMLTLTVATGVVHLETGPSHKFWFRVSQVLVFVISVVIGLFFGTSASMADRGQ
jgi:hypothetical protein